MRMFPLCKYFWLKIVTHTFLPLLTISQLTFPNMAILFSLAVRIPRPPLASGMVIISQPRKCTSFPLLFTNKYYLALQSISLQTPEGNQHVCIMCRGIVVRVDWTRVAYVTLFSSFDLYPESFPSILFKICL